MGSFIGDFLNLIDRSIPSKLNDMTEKELPALLKYIEISLDSLKQKIELSESLNCDLKSKLEETENKLITKQSELNDISLVLKNKSEILFDHEEERVHLVGQSQKLNKSLCKLECQVQQLTNELKSAHLKISDQEKCVRAREKEISAKESHIKHISAMVAKLESNLANSEDKIEILKKDNSNLKNDITNRDLKVKSLKKELFQFSEVNNELKEKLSVIDTNLAGRCEKEIHVKAELEKSGKIIKQANNDYINLKEKLSVIEKEKSALEMKNKSIMQQLSSAKSDLVSRTNNFNAVNEKFFDLQRSHKELQNKLEQQIQALTETKSSNHKLGKENLIFCTEIKQLKKTYQQKETMVKELQGDLKSLKIERQSLLDKIAKFEKTQQNISSKEKYLKNLSNTN